MAQYTPNHNLGKPDASDPFGDFRQLFNDNMDKIDQIGGGSGGHTIVDENGADMPAEGKLQFTGAVSVTDDNVNGATIVDILGGGGSNLILDAQIYSTEEKQVGVWTDNKPLYCKTVQTAIPNNSQASYPHNIADIDTIVRIEGGAWGSNQLLPVNMTGYVYNNNEGALRVTVTKTNVVVMPLGWDGSGYTGYWNVYYTKTTDVAGSGGYEAYGFSPVIYSDVERKIGVWRDNKPLYQKTIVTTYNSSATSYQIDVSALNLETIGNAILSVGSDNYMAEVGDYYSSSSDHIRWYYERSIEKVTIEFGNAYPTKPFEVRLTLQYTKTTDVAGSGDYNTYGVPTVHYSTSEQVIGTYLGKPLYQRTWDFVSTNIINANTWTNLFSNDIDIDKVTMNETLDDEGRSNKVAYCGVRNGYIAVYSTYATNIQTITLRYTKTTDT